MTSRTMTTAMGASAMSRPAVTLPAWRCRCAFRRVGAEFAPFQLRLVGDRWRCERELRQADHGQIALYVCARSPEGASWKWESRPAGSVPGRYEGSTMAGWGSITEPERGMDAKSAPVAEAPGRSAAPSVRRYRRLGGGKKRPQGAAVHRFLPIAP